MMRRPYGTKLLTQDVSDSSILICMEKRAAIYTRSARANPGPDLLQEQECRRLCDEQQWRVVAAENDAASGNDENRPGWNSILSMAKAGEIDVIVALSPDRISRSWDALAVLGDLARNHGVGFATARSGIHTSPEDAQIIRLRTMFNEHEAERSTD